MATSENTTRPSHSQAAPTIATAQEVLCNHCHRPITKRVLAARKSYCGKLCAALGMIVAVVREDGIDEDFTEFLDLMVKRSVERLVDDDDRPVIPVRVRSSDALKYAESEKSDDSIVFIVIEDRGTPDWVPDPILDADQEEIDAAVDRPLS